MGYTYQLKNNFLMIKYTNNTIRKINRKLNKSYEDNFDFYYKSLNSYKVYFYRCNTSLYFNKFKLMEINNLFDKYKIVKDRYYDSIVFVKCKHKFYTYGSDLEFVNRNLNNKKYNSLNYNKLNKFIKLNRDFVILNGNNILENRKI